MTNRQVEQWNVCPCQKRKKSVEKDLEKQPSNVNTRAFTLLGRACDSINVLLNISIFPPVDQNSIRILKYKSVLYAEIVDLGLVIMK